MKKGVELTIKEPEMVVISKEEILPDGNTGYVGQSRALTIACPYNWIELI